MTNSPSSLLAKSLNYASQFLHKSSEAKNLISIKKLHAHLLRTNLLFLSIDVHTQLIFSYVTCLDQNNLKTLVNCFKFVDPTNPFAYNVLLSHFYRNGFPSYALKTLSFMHRSCLPLDSYALCSCLIAASSTKNANFGKQLHAHVAKLGWLSSVFVGSALVDLYGKLSLVDYAGNMFDEIPVKNTVCANALLSGFSEVKLWDKVIELVRKMPILELHYDHCTVSVMLRACTGLSAVELGRQVHAFVIRRGYGLETDVFLQSSLIELYGKCGFVANAARVFRLQGFMLEGRRNKDLVLWTSMLGVYGRNGQFNEVIELYGEMLKEGIGPDGVAFVTVISACGRTGRVKLGMQLFESMARDFMLSPCAEHYSCVVDMLCKAGELDRAWELINEMIGKGHESPSISLWGALLSACEEHGKIELGELAAQRALTLEPNNVGIYVMLSNLYAKFRMWDKITQLREMMRKRGLKKDVGCSWVEVTNLL